LDIAEQKFGKIDRNILFPMADHIEYAVKRIKNQEQISNPLTEDIRVLFHMEFKVAQEIVPILRERMGIEIEEDEVGYIALHIHSAIDDQKVSQAMQVAQAVRECISQIEQEIGRPIDVMSLAYNRLMNHIRYMAARAMKGEALKINMNDYMGIKFPNAFQIAERVCKQVERNLKCEMNDVEIGYLAMHIERVANEELDAKE
jgi:Transcriptional antiterminator